MAEPKNGQKGFAGLSDLANRKEPETPAAPDSRVGSQEKPTVLPDPANLPGKSKAPGGRAAHVPASQTAAPSGGSRAAIVVIIAGVILLVLMAAFMQEAQREPTDGAAHDPTTVYDAQSAAAAVAQSAGSLSPDQEAAAAAQVSADAAAAAANAAAEAADASSGSAAPFSGLDASTPGGEQTPSVGTDLVLYGPQIRYCVNEKIRLDAAEKVVDARDGNSVDRFNGMVDDYNGRCGSFRYRPGDLESIRAEAELNRGALEAQGRDRFPAMNYPTAPVEQVPSSDLSGETQSSDATSDAGDTAEDPSQSDPSNSEDQ